MMSQYEIDLYVLTLKDVSQRYYVEKRIKNSMYNILFIENEKQRLVNAQKKSE